ncbi:DUF433 domain-containing protein [Solwaraspora sp. WMMA2065]|uniref:DUF433 domain-containing protein n=1 Tax=Solwaraspora sp. WMMA2065 TaxID=3015166 RepID=UPI00259BE571|nr:DUF433 domain-containing protein [Solwaraspora sp. WMMA2065]WJK33492.1 DUF433 domain-containing protein [Solwaraspora sp. WMMA2065]
MYAEAAAARLLRVPPSTLRRWLAVTDGRQRRSDPSGSRAGPPGRRILDWAEFVEAAYLREHRQAHRVSMSGLPIFLALLRDQFGVPHPIADRRVFTDGRAVVWEVQAAASLHPRWWLVVTTGDRLTLTPQAAAFHRRVGWAGDSAASYRPDPSPDSPVRIRPDVRFGRPAIGGVSTESIAEHQAAGTDPETIAEMYALTPADVAWALAYESGTRPGR